MRSTRRRRPRRARQEGGLRRAPAPALAGAVGGLEDPRAPARRRGPRPARGTDPRAGPGDARPRRLPARQHDPRALGRGRRGRRLGALHARRSARRRRAAARLLGRGGRRAPAAVRAGDDGARVLPNADVRRALRGELGPRPGPDRLLHRARLLEAGDHPRGRLLPLREGPVRQARSRFEEFGKNVERLADAANDAANRPPSARARQGAAGTTASVPSASGSSAVSKRSGSLWTRGMRSRNSSSVSRKPIRGVR